MKRRGSSRGLQLDDVSAVSNMKGSSYTQMKRRGSARGLQLDDFSSMSNAKGCNQAPMRRKGSSRALRMDDFSSISNKNAPLTRTYSGMSLGTSSNAKASLTRTYSGMSLGKMANAKASLTRTYSGDYSSMATAKASLTRTYSGECSTMANAKGSLTRTYSGDCSTMVNAKFSARTSPVISQGSEGGSQHSDTVRSAASLSKRADRRRSSKSSLGRGSIRRGTMGRGSRRRGVLASSERGAIPAYDTDDISEMSVSMSSSSSPSQQTLSKLPTTSRRQELVATGPGVDKDDMADSITQAETVTDAGTIAPEKVDRQQELLSTKKACGYWNCVCGSEMEDMNIFCGHCGTKRFWKCNSCPYDKNSNIHLFCGICGIAKEQ